MSAKVFSQPYLTVEEFLASEELRGEKCEYLGGMVHAMAGASDSHNFIEINLTGMLHGQRRGRRCNAFGSIYEAAASVPIVR